MYMNHTLAWTLDHISWLV